MIRDTPYTPVAVKEALAKKIPGATVTVLPHSHHAAPLERPETFNRALDETLRAWAV
jgi:3-oxoadipate enol-lactonase